MRTTRALLHAWPRVMLAHCLGLLCLACGSETEPDVGGVRIVVATEGDGPDLDPDGYEIEGLLASALAVPVAGDLIVGELPADQYVLTLKNISANCAAVNLTRTVTVVPNDTIQVIWTLTCSPRAARLTVTLTMPPDASVGSFGIAIGNIPPQTLAAGEQIVLEELAAGAYQIRLTGTPNCRLLGVPPEAVHLTSGSDVTVSLNAECSPGRLFFEWTGQPWEIDSDGSDLRAAAGFETYDVRTPAVSPSGNELAFADHTVSLIVIDLLTAAADTILSMSGVRGPTWSPGGTRIAFWGTEASTPGNADIYLVDRDGSNLRKLTDHPAQDINPTWSPDGTRIAFDSQRSGSGSDRIYVMNADGSGLSTLELGQFPVWSPDGSTIAFRSSGTRLALMNPDGSNVRHLADSPINLWSLSWSPDGRMIAAHASDVGIVMIDRSGGTTTIFPEPDDEFLPTLYWAR